jgi:hypothetical protein
MFPTDKLFTFKTDVTAVDIPTMFEMSDDEYRVYAKDGLLFTDHHGVLRSAPARYGIATTREQVDILISVLEELRWEVSPR